MEISVAKSAGFCFGVKNAVDVAIKTAQKSANVCTFGEIIHNKIVVNQLIGLGVRVVEDITDIKVDDVVIIRSHGIGKSVLEDIKTRAKEYVDATCPFVSKIHKIVELNHKSGRKIIIIGEASHPEVLGINGWCDGTATVISTTDFVELDDTQEYCVVCQTTFSAEMYQNITEYIKNKVKIVEFFNTICYTTKERQSEAVNLAKKCDVMLVLGSKHSSNTQKLLELCKKYCKDSFLIESIADVLSVVANKIKRLGITAGASTPQELIEEVVNTMSESQNKSEMTLNEEGACVCQAKEEVNKDTMENYMDRIDESFKSVQVQQGKTYDVTIISSSEKGISVSFGGKKDGFIDRTEVELVDTDFKPENFKPGDSMKAMVIENNKDKTSISFSKKRVDIKAKERQECEEILKGGEFSVVIDKAVKGGLTSKLGPYTIFIPASQIRIGYVNDLEKYVGKKMRLSVLPPKADEGEVPQEISINSKRIVASQRVILEKEKMDREDSFWSTMEIGSIVSGKVKRFSTFGAFVMVNGFDCLAHISDLSWYKIEDPAEVIELNKSYDFVVIKADRESNRVSLGYKQLQKKPYEIAYEKYPVGINLTCKVERVFPYGAFVSIDKGVDGLIPVSEISHSWIKNAAEAYKPGDEVEAQIISFEGNKITLSAKILLPEPVFVEGEENQNNNNMSEQQGENRQNRRKTPFASERKPRASKRDDDEIKEWTSESNSSATLGDLLKDLDFKFDKE